MMTEISIDALYDTINELKSSNMELEDANARLEEQIQELYNFRMLYNALAFNALYKQDEIIVYKSKRHYNGELCFDGEYFVVIAILPTGQITNHYHIDYWDLFQIPSKMHVEHEFDGHTPETVIQRLDDFVRNSELVRL